MENKENILTSLYVWCHRLKWHHLALIHIFVGKRHQQSLRYLTMDCRIQPVALLCKKKKQII